MDLDSVIRWLRRVLLIRLWLGDVPLSRHLHRMLVPQMPIHLHCESAAIFVAQPAEMEFDTSFDARSLRRDDANHVGLCERNAQSYAGILEQELSLHLETRMIVASVGWIGSVELSAFREVGACRGSFRDRSRGPFFVQVSSSPRTRNTGHV